MSERGRQKILLFFPFAVLAAGMILTPMVWIDSCGQIAFEHTSALCEMILAKAPEVEPQLLAALKAYHTLSEQEWSGNHYLDRYGYRAADFCNGFPPDAVLFPVLLFLAAALAFAAGLWLADRRKRKRIAALTAYLEQVNAGAEGTLIQAEEDAYSYLQDEIYKTVTALYQTRERALAARKNFAENLANIAHQLKTPITAASLSLQLMKKEAPVIYTDQMEGQLERLHCLEESLLTLSQIDVGTLPLKQQEVDLYTVLNLAADNLDDLMRKNRISVEIPEKGCIAFSGDLEWTMEALINLLKNCMEHSPPGGTIHCDYAENPLYVEIRIWDGGPGFDPEDLPHLFQRFYRGRHAVGNGIGIGLALARSLLERQNGTIHAYNLQGGGACFEIRIYRH